MSSQGQSSVTVESNRLWRIIFSILRLRRFTRLAVRGLNVQFERHSGPVGNSIEIKWLEDIHVRRSPFRLGWRFTAIGPAGESYHIDGLSQQSAGRTYADVVRLAASIAKEIGPRLTELEGRLSTKGYMRFRASRDLHKDIVDQLSGIGRLVEKSLADGPFRAFSRLSRLLPEEDFERARTEWNRQFVEGRMGQVRDSALAHISRALTDEQCTAIAIDEEATLVLAGAGTGKTSVIVGKVVDLVTNQGVLPQEVLVLAYNTKAAAEIRDRLPEGLRRVVNVSTFHGFGMSVISSTENGKPTVSSLAEDDTEMRAQLQRFLVEVAEDPEMSALIVDYLAYYAIPYRSPLDFQSQDEYDLHVQEVELRTLNGELVKSFEELLIANFLARNGIEYKYEDDYEVNTRTRKRRQYQPDFFLPQENIYIEHFALDEDGRAPRQWNWREYERSVEWKRQLHAKHQTNLIESYSWQRSQGTLLKDLEESLRRHGVSMRPVPDKELLTKLSQETYSALATLILQFLNHVGTSRIAKDTLRERARGFGDPERAQAFLHVFERVHARYTAFLEQRGEIDFHNMINAATDAITERRWRSQYRYVLVDEFQDISSGRMEFLKALHGQGATFFLVGDDWQSIYRFAGSDVGLVTRCGEYLGYVETCSLGQTFRYGAGIEGVSSWFVQRNPAQTKRGLRPFGDVRHDDGVTVIWADDPGAGLNAALLEIQQSLNSGPGTVYALTRYGRTTNAVKHIKETGRLRVRHSTVHSAKGEEDDYVVVFDLKKDLRLRTGFPSAGNEDPLLELVLPPRSDDGRYEFAEERRVFYVAMTRARYGAFLVADRGSPSPFIDELLDRFGGRSDAHPAGTPFVRQIGEPAERCPQCKTGHLVLRTNTRDGNRFWGCSNYPKAQVNCTYTRNAPEHPPIAVSASEEP